GLVVALVDRHEVRRARALETPVEREADRNLLLGGRRARNEQGGKKSSETHEFPLSDYRGGARKCHSVARWKACPARRAVASSRGGAMSCIPIGMPAWVSPALAQ